MDFGNVNELTNIDFTLPLDHPDCPKSTQSTKKLNFYLSLPVWADPKFVGKIIPLGTSKEDYLKVFSHSFNSIELNSTFYGIPSSDKINRWKKSVNEDFKFSVKIPRSISHESLDPKELHYFTNSIKPLEENLGNVFLQLGPSFSPLASKELIAFLKKRDPHIDFYIEFRHPAWFKDSLNAENVFSFMKDNNIHSVLTDVAGRRDVLSMRTTSNKVIIRFKGYALIPSDFSRIDAWIDRLKVWQEKGIQEVYFFLHQASEDHGIDLAEYMIPRLNEKLGLNLKLPVRVKTEEQISFI